MLEAHHSQGPKAPIRVLEKHNLYHLCVVAQSRRQKSVSISPQTSARNHKRGECLSQNKPDI